MTLIAFIYFYFKGSHTRLIYIYINAYIFISNFISRFYTCYKSFMHIYFKHQNKHYSYRQYFFLGRHCYSFVSFFFRITSTPLRNPDFVWGAGLVHHSVRWNFNQIKISLQVIHIFYNEKHIFHFSLSICRAAPPNAPAKKLV